MRLYIKLLFQMYCCAKARFTADCSTQYSDEFCSSKVMVVFVSYISHKLEVKASCTIFFILQLFLLMLIIFKWLKFLSQSYSSKQIDLYV